MKNTKSRIFRLFFYLQYFDHENQINQNIEMDSPIIDCSNKHIYGFATVGNIWQRYAQYVIQI